MQWIHCLRRFFFCMVVVKWLSVCVWPNAGVHNIFTSSLAASFFMQIQYMKTAIPLGVVVSISCIHFFSPDASYLPSWSQSKQRTWGSSHWYSTSEVGSCNRKCFDGMTDVGKWNWMIHRSFQYPLFTSQPNSLHFIYMFLKKRKEKKNADLGYCI